MSKESETRIIVNYNVIGESSEPILIIKPGESEEWCSEVHIQGSSTIRYDKNIVYTTTNARVDTLGSVTKKTKRKVKYEPGMISCAGVEHIDTNTEEIDFTLSDCQD